MARDYQEYAWHFRVLADAQRDGKLVFVLGAGVSVPYGLPNWQQLLANLLLDSGRMPRLATRTSETPDKERDALIEIITRIAPDPLIQGAIARVAYPGDRWREAIRSQLAAAGLQNPAEDHVHKAERTAAASGKRPALLKIARLLVDSIQKDPHRHLSVLTFNYDSLLDIAVAHELKQRNLDRSLIQSVSDGREFERTWVNAGIYIYHLHGHFTLAPAERHLPFDTVLDADSYLPVLRGDHWSWRCMERALTGTGYASLFIGLSLADPSLRYVLTRWGHWQTPMTGVYLAPPPELPGVDYGPVAHVDDQRTLALMYRSVMDLYSTVLDRLHLVCYYLSSWNEIADILEQLESPR